MRLIAMTLLMGILTVGGQAAMALELEKSPGAVSFQTLDGWPRVMDNYKDRAGTAVVFLSARCDKTLGALGMLSKLQQGDEREKMLVVGICSNPEETGDELRTFCQRRGVVFPVYRDPDGKAARQFGATVTPECFLLDRSGALVYHGSVENLEEPFREVMEGRNPKAASGPVQGTPIDKPGPKREVEDLYGAMSYASEFIFTSIPNAVAYHCSTITEAANGDIVCIWYGGTYESAEDQVLFIARLKKGERIWSAPQVLIRNPDQPPGNAVIFRDPTDKMWVVWGRMEGTRPVRRGGGWSKCRLMYRTSTDNGMTWSEDQPFPDAFTWLPRNAPFHLNSGELVLPITAETDTTNTSVLLKLGKDGAWTKFGAIPGAAQPTALQRPNGDLMVMMRDAPRIQQSESTDGGQTWTPIKKTDLKCPDSGIAMLRLKSGRVLLVHNDNDSPEGERFPLTLEQSYDEGRTWTDRRILEADWGEFSYPCLIQSSDGMIHLTYTYRRFSIKHVTFDENWLKQLERPN